MLHTETGQVALDAVRRAAILTCEIQHLMVSDGLKKEDKSPVTVGDFVAQAIVAQILAEHFPADPLVAEERSEMLRRADGKVALKQVTGFVSRELGGVTPQTVCNLIDRGASEPAERFWTLDPIDGTKGFLRRDQFAVCLALIERGQVQLGVMGCPKLNLRGEVESDRQGAMFYAARGQGAWVEPIGPNRNISQPQQVRVSQQSDISAARMLRSVESGHTDVDKIDELVARLKIVAEPVAMDSQAKYAVLAAGGGELLLRLVTPSRPDYREKIWDQAAGAIVVEEAGGRVSDLDGKPLDFGQGRTLASNRGVFVSNGFLHDTVLAVLAEIGA